MKKVFMVLACIIFVSSLGFAQDEIVTLPVLSNVKIFLRGAELNYNSKIKIEKGLHDVVLTGLADNIDQNSINVSAKGDATILSVGQRFNYLRPLEKTPKVKMLEDSLEILTKSLAMNQSDKDVLDAEIELLMANKSIGNEKIGVSVTELQKMSEYFRKRLTEIKSRTYDISLIAKKIQKNIDRIQNQLNELNNKLNRPTNEIIVTLSQNSTSTVEFNFSYLINNAGWNPIYDVRADKINSPVTLNYKANVWQNSSIDWNDVEIILSTRNPVANNNKPELYPWFIDFLRPLIAQPMQKSMLNRNTSNNQIQMAASPIAEEAAGTMADYMEVNAMQLSVEFTPKIKYSIPSDSKSHSVALQDLTVPASFEYYAAPKLDLNAFLVARLTDWNSYNLLPGQANIYFENSYVGQSYINPVTTKNTLSISLGRDQNISVSRDVLKDFSEDKFLSSNVERTFAYEIKIKNNKKAAAKIVVEDQIPLSKNEDITVKLIESSGASINNEDGKLKWIVDVDGGKSVSKKLVYSVKYPGDKAIQGL
jgi:uncharacterized protein (TIGR02231 family)